MSGHLSCWVLELEEALGCRVPEGAQGEARRKRFWGPAEWCGESVPSMPAVTLSRPLPSTESPWAKRCLMSWKRKPVLERPGHGLPGPPTNLNMHVPELPQPDQSSTAQSCSAVPCSVQPSPALSSPVQLIPAQPSPALHALLFPYAMQGSLLGGLEGQKSHKAGSRGQVSRSPW